MNAKLNRRSLGRKPKRTRLIQTTAGWMLEEQLEKASKFDSRSFATVRPGGRTAILIGCPRGKWDPKAPLGQQCKVGTRGYLKVKALSPAEATRQKEKGVPVVVDRRAGMARLRGQAATANRSMKFRTSRKGYVAAKTGRGRVYRNAKRLARPKTKVKPKPKKRSTSRGLTTAKSRALKRKRRRAASNYLLMTVSNPVTATKSREKAERAFKKWHLKGHSSVSTVKNVPDHYPDDMINLGKVNHLDIRVNGKTYRWKPPGARPVVAANPEGTKAFVLTGDFSDVPKGARLAKIEYFAYTPPRSNRVKHGGPDWYHPFDNPPIIHVNKGGGFWMSTPVKPEGFDG